MTSLVLDEFNEGLGLTLSQAGKLMPGRKPGKGINPSTIFRWIRDGVKKRDGQRVRLEAAKVGGRFLTTRPALERFIKACSDLCNDTPPIRSPTQRNAAVRRAEKELIELGA